MFSTNTEILIGLVMAIHEARHFYITDKHRSICVPPGLFAIGILPTLLFSTVAILYHTVR